MKLSPYTTFSCSGYILEKTIQELQLELTINQDSSAMQVETGLRGKVYLLINNPPFNPPAFAHPLDIVINAGRGTYEEKTVVQDVRPFTKISPQHGVITTNFVERNLAERRAILHSIWVTSDSYLIRNVCGSLMGIFSAWVSESISKRLDMNAITQLKVANIAAWWFWCQYNNPEDLDASARPKIYKLIAEQTRSSYDTVEEDLDGLEYFDDVESFCFAVKDRSDNPRVKHLDAGALIQLTSVVWMGTYSKEIMSVCLEYPPYLCAVVYSALHERGMRMAAFSKLVQRYATRPEIKGFKEAIDHLQKH